MKHCLIILLFICGAVCAETRVWTNQDGKRVKAELISASEDTAQLKLKNTGKTYTVKLATLSEADQTFIKDWLEAKAEEIAEKKRDAMMIDGVKLNIGGITHINVKYTENLNKITPRDFYELSIALPKNFDPINKQYTIVQVFVPGKGASNKAVGSYARLAREADCVVFGVNNIGSKNVALTSIYYRLNKKWGVADKQWPVAFYGFSGGAKKTGMHAAPSIKHFKINLIGCYMSGCNEDYISKELYKGKLRGSEKKQLKNIGVWLSSGTKDKIATPQQHKNVAASLRQYGIKNVKINTFQGAHVIHQDDLIPALRWMQQLNK